MVYMWSDMYEVRRRHWRDGCMTAVFTGNTASCDFMTLLKCFGINAHMSKLVFRKCEIEQLFHNDAPSNDQAEVSCLTF